MNLTISSLPSCSQPEPGVVFQTESWAAYWADPDRPWLWMEEYLQSTSVHCGMELGANEAMYAELEASGALVVLTARKLGRLIGYCHLVCHRHPHHPVLCAFEDTYFVSKPERKGLVGLRLIKAAVEEARKRGCARLFWQTPEFGSVALLLERLGMKKVYSTYSMSLEG